MHRRLHGMRVHMCLGGLGILTRCIGFSFSSGACMGLGLAKRATPLLRDWWAPGLQGRWGPASPWYRPASLEVEVAEMGVKPGLIRGLSVIVVGTHEDDVVDAEACELHKGLEEGRMGVWIRLEEHRKVLFAVGRGGLVPFENL